MQTNKRRARRSMDSTNGVATGVGASPGPRAKRQKVGEACGPCRDRKQRCDGTRPVCASCRKRGSDADCKFEKQTSVSVRYLHQLKERIRNLEGAPTSSNGVLTAPEQGNSDRNAPEPPQSNYRERPTVPVSIDQTSPTSINSSAPSTTFSVAVDGLATVASSADNECIYGESSTIAFAQHIRGQGQAPSAVTHEPTLEPIPQRDETAAVYPRRSIADEYLHCFYEFIHPIFPIVQKSSFSEQYEHIWSRDEYSSAANPQARLRHSVFEASLNLALALGCQSSSRLRAENRSQVADEFYQRARKVFIYDVLDSASIPMVQMLLLTGVYLQSTRHADRCWNAIGLAIRAAQSIGLHSEERTTRPHSQVEREMRRRLWHVCVMMDRLVSMTFGRPMMTSGAPEVPKPLIIDDQYLAAEGEGRQPDGCPSQLALFVSSTSLYDILDEILAKLYQRRRDQQAVLASDSSLQQTLATILALNARLDSFLDSVPEYLQTTSAMSPFNMETAGHIRLQQQILQCRFLYTRILLLRPLLLTGAKHNSPLNFNHHRTMDLPHLDTDIIGSACNLCVRTAHLLIMKLHENMETPYRLSAWHTVYLTVGSAIVLLAAQRCPIVDERLKVESSGKSWDHCLNILSHYKQQVATSQQAIQLLQALKQDLITQQGGEPRSGDAYWAKEDRQQESANADGTMTSQGLTALGTQSNPDFIDVFWDNPEGDSINNSWLSQHLVNLDWLEMPSNESLSR